MKPHEVESQTEVRYPRFIGGSWRELAQAFGLPTRAVKGWYDLGAPIVMIGDKPVAEAWELWTWLREHLG
jgi:phage terminase Nu1 subunit (DNA packaging protein)